MVKETDDYELKIRMPIRKPAPEIGRLTCFTFAKAQVIVGTSRGAVVLYSSSVANQDNVSMNYEDLKFIKMLKVEQKKINVIQSIDG